tara:strand:+ start:747 stop:1163 length:417 start_codon:yes stop_codon:yes gene_type:complete
MVTSTEQTKFMAELKKTNTENGRLTNDFANHIEAYKASFMSDQFYKDKNDAWRAGVDKKIESLKAFYDGKIDQMNFELSRKIKIDDMKQNFKQLNDILAIKFKQLEDTKDAMRSLIVFNKYYQPIMTQQLISESLMNL